MKNEHTVADKGTIDFNDVTAFTRVVEAASFTRAAAQLGLPKSVVSRRVARLEEALGARLLQRTTRRLQLTDAGTRFHQRAAAALAALDEAATCVGELQAEPRGTVRFTAPGDLQEHLAPALAEFAERYPDVEVEAVLTMRRVDLVAEGFDFALRAGTLRDSSFRARRIMSAPLGLIAAPAYLDRRGTPKTPDDLTKHDCVLFRPENGRSRWPLVKDNTERTVTVRGPIAGDDFAFVRSLTLCGVGIAFMPLLTCAADLAEGRLVRVLPAWRGPSGGLYLVYPTARLVPQRVLLLREHLYESLRASLGSDT
jgi:DNA-binding transcriptional LysR family regulator